MRHTEKGDNWDFTPVIELLYTLTDDGKEANPGKEINHALVSRSKTSLTTPARDEIYEHNTRLGDFDNVLKYIGQPSDSNHLEDLVHSASVYNAGEGLSNTKAVRWRDETSDEAIAEGDEKRSSSNPLRRTKTQRKKERRRQRRSLEESINDNDIASSSSADVKNLDTQHANSLGRKEIIHRLLHGSLAIDAKTKVNKTAVLKQHKTIISLERRFTDNHAGDRDWRTSDLSDKEALARAATKKARLIDMLRERFIDERQYLNNLTLIHHSSGDESKGSEGIHIFIDASNIIIGFHDALKVSRALPIIQRIRRQPISFHSLSLILSRGRPTSKRIVVGSDNLSEMQEAKEIGYETNILDRVHKAKELTPRQRKFLPNGNFNNAKQSAGSGSETTTAAQYAPEKWVEQAVDEILHLKMMESIVDASEPSTMVLATGDAAEAEYSGGFLKMVERALMKGWKVELASFRHNTSGAYRDKEFRQKWGQIFKTIELDDFVGVLSSER